jgi:predicted nucleic acid-binding protein
VSAVSLTEVAGHMRSAERRQVSRLLSSLRAFPVTERVAWRATELMREHRRSHQGIGLGDSLIAATADVEGLELATLNVRHFPMIKDLQAPFRV